MEPPLGSRYQVGSTRLALHHEGNGTPPVVFLPGAGMVGLDYLNLHRRMARTTTSVLYDRAGTGWSEEDGWPRTATQVAGELAVLLATAEVPGPYVLVGHSMGGAYARRFAQLHPGQVAGLVLLEPLHEDWDAYMPEGLRLEGQPPAEESMPEFGAELVEQFRVIFNQQYAEWPDDLRELIVGRHLRADLLLRGLQENRTAVGVTAELREGGAIPDVPLTVVTALGVDPGQALFLSSGQLEAQNAAKLEFYAHLAGSVPRGEHVVLDSGGHSSLHLDRPDDVAKAIHQLLSRTAGAR